MAGRVFTYEQFSESPRYVKPQIIEREGRLTLQLDWGGKGGSLQYLPLPRYVESVERIPRRSLTVRWGEGSTSLEMCSSLLEGLSTYVSLRYPGWWVVVPTKVYEQLPHGIAAPNVWSYIPVVGALHEIRDGVESMERRGGFWSGGFSDVLLISPEPDFNLSPGELLKVPWDVPKIMFIPMFDFDIYSSGGNPENDLGEAAALLAESGFSGWIIRSGDNERGGYHFVSDLLLPHGKDFWRVRGRWLNLLTPKREQYGYLHDYASQLEEAADEVEVRRIARQILDQKRGIPSNFATGSFIDFRWMAHSLEQGVGILRVLRSKGYAKPPVVIGEIK